LAGGSALRGCALAPQSAVLRQRHRQEAGSASSRPSEASHLAREGKLDMGLGLSLGAARSTTDVSVGNFGNNPLAVAGGPARGRRLHDAKAGFPVASFDLHHAEIWAATYC
jgi:hypothetical protein